MRAWLIQTFRTAAWAPVLVFVSYVIAAKGFHAYLIYPNIDMPTHFLGGLAITYFYLYVLHYAQSQLGPIPRLIQQIAALGLTAMTAISWEFFELVSDLAWSTQMSLGTKDTLSDLFFGMFGGTMMVLLAKRPSPLPGLN